MASISRTSKQIIVQEYWQGRRFNFSFRLDQEEEAEAQKAWLESEKRRAKQVGKPPAFSLADDAKRKQREAADEAQKGRVKRPRTRTAPAKLFEDFARHKRPDWHGNTETTYIHAWDSFCRNVPFRSVEQLSLSDVQKYKDKPVSPKGQVLSETTIHNNLKRIFAILSFAHSRDLLGFNPAEASNVKLTEQPNPYLTKEEIESLCKAVDSASFDIAAVFYLGMFAGLRKNEILNARWNWFHPLEALTENGGGRHELPDIDWDDGNAVEGLPGDVFMDLVDKGVIILDEDLQLYSVNFSAGLFEFEGDNNLVLRVMNDDSFRAKSGKIRNVPVHLKLKMFMKDHISKMEDSGGYIVKPGKGYQVDRYRWDFRKQFTGVLKAAGLETVNRYGKDEPVTPHVLRYTFCSMLAQSGKFNAYDIMTYAGHADLKTAERYMWLAPERVELDF